MPAPALIKLGVGLVLVNHDGEVLLSRRKVANGLGTFGGPGGTLKPGESLDAAMIRELAEECGDGLEIAGLRKLCVINYRRYAPVQFVGIGFAARLVSGAVRDMEPHKHEAWGWYSIDALPAPLFEPVAQYVEAFRTGRVWFD